MAETDWETELRLHLRSRHVGVSADQAQYTVWFGHCQSSDRKVVLFGLFNLSGQIVGYQQYYPGGSKERKNDPRAGRYYTYVTGDKRQKEIAVFGLETFHIPGPLFIVEGIFDAVRLHNLGYSAIATLSNDPKHLRNWFYAINRKIVAVCDNDEGGRKLAKYGHEHVFVHSDNDLGGLTPSQLRVFDKRYLHDKL